MSRDVNDRLIFSFFIYAQIYCAVWLWHYIYSIVQSVRNRCTSDPWNTWFLLFIPCLFFVFCFLYILQMMVVMMMKSVEHERPPRWLYCGVAKSATKISTRLNCVALNWVEIWAAFLQSALSDESITICSSCSLSRLTEPQSYYSRFCSRRQHTYSPRYPSARHKWKTYKYYEYLLCKWFKQYNLVIIQMTE